MPHNHRRSHIAHRHLEDAANNLEARQPDVATVVSIVYVTASKTFSGPAVFITDGPVMTKGSPVQTSIDSGTTSEAKSHGDASTKHRSTVTSSDKSSTATPSSTSQSSQGNQLLVASSTLSASAVAATSATATPTPSSGMSGGAKAGLVLGILIAIAAVLALVLLFYHKKKKNMQHQQLDDEKGSIRDSAPVAASIRTARTMSTAPRLSLRPVTQFSPNLASNRKSAGNNLEMAAAPTANSQSDSRGFLTPTVQPSKAWERPGAVNNVNDPANPFGIHAETVEPVSAPMTPEQAPASAQSEMSPLSGNPVVPEAPTPAAPAPAAPVVAAVTAPLPSPVVRKDLPQPLTPKSDMPVPMAMPSPAWTDDIPASPGPAPTGPPPIAVAGGVAAGPGPAPAPNNVHRVQLDFKPSMNDELELRAGQLVRMLHEYDDGWALCTRLDRSQQGVAPRTCLSKHPVKPRTGPPRQGPPPGAPKIRGPPMGPGLPQPRPLSPANGRNSPGPFIEQPRSMSPAGGRNSPGPYGQPRPMSPASGRNSPGPYNQQRSMSPAGPRGRLNSNAPYAGPPRSMSPGPYGGGPQRPIPAPEGRRRSNSASQVMARRASPPGPSPMNPNPYGAPIPVRKPVPGQAL
ncbi:hypothetical protein AOQ84DRAFT_370271 [Glonium stellatum]|uniref:SH3 domain-containing protein n=1 Tax=Glonium stellatum TaxID=574774 RepID=A0A8E2EM55_9PEZI|nr:hypothetical protein AOQ84DRAFT_370271 [Glonium stellatum]